MELYVKEDDLPKCCSDCACCSEIWCGAKDGRELTYKELSEQRPDDCPLKDIREIISNVLDKAKERCRANETNHFIEVLKVLNEINEEVKKNGL